MKSDTVKQGIERAGHRALLRAVGCTEKELEQPFIGIVNSFSEIVPGHIHLRTIAEAVKSGEKRSPPNWRDPLRGQYHCCLRWHCHESPWYEIQPAQSRDYC